MTKKITVYLLYGIFCFLTGCMTFQPSWLEPGLYNLQLYFAPDTNEDELKKVFGETLLQIKGSMISRAARSMEGEEGQKWRTIMVKARNNDFQSILSTPISSLPLSLWNDFPVYLSKNKTIMKIPDPGLQVPYIFDERLFNAHISLTPVVTIDLQGKMKNRKTITGTFTMQWYNKKTRTTEQCQPHGSFTIQRTGPIPDNMKNK